jgi:hypothetical protein
MPWTSVPGQCRGGLGLPLGLSLAALRCQMGEETPAFLRGRPLPDELEEDATGGAPAGAVFGQHAAVGLTRERVCEDGGTAVLPQDPQDLRE